MLHLHKILPLIFSPLAIVFMPHETCTQSGSLLKRKVLHKLNSHQEILVAVTVGNSNLQNHMDARYHLF